MRLCKKCGVEKSDESFYHHKKGFRYECKECFNLRHIFYKYDLTREQRDALLIKQDNRCAICKEKKKLGVDHCHKTDKVRGLVCNWCNSYLGAIEADPSILKRIEEYLWK